jgi:predicted ATP-binding protein involved in virulence
VDARIRRVAKGPRAARVRKHGCESHDAQAKVMTETQPNLVTNPADDRAFRDAAEAALLDGQSVEELQRILRHEYPRVVVRARDLTGERPIVWYVYREGHWVGGHDREQG